MEEQEERRVARGAPPQRSSAPSREGGGGEAEGFEEAEEELIEHASHGDSGPDPSNLAGEPEELRGRRVRRGRPRAVERGPSDED